MSGHNSAKLERSSWLRRVLQVHLPDGEYSVEYSSRSLSNERIAVNGQVERQTRISSWFRPIFRFFVGSRPATIAVRVSPWLTIPSFHLLIDGQVLYCDRHRDFFDGQEPRRTSFGYNNDPFCPYCERRLNGVGLDLAALPAALAAADGLIGRPTGVFTFARRHRVALMVAGGLAIVGGIALLSLLLLLPWGNAPGDWQGVHGASLLGVVFLGVGPLALFFALRNRRLQAVTGNEGVALIENDVVSLCRWSEVATVTESQIVGDLQSVLQASVRGEDHYFRVRCRDGTELVFRNFLDDLPWLAKILQRETLPHLMPPAVAALEKGEVLYFGPLVLDQEGIRSGEERRLAWDEVEDMKVANAVLLVMQRGKRWAWFKTPLGEVPNAHVLLALVQGCRKKAPSID